MLGHGKEDNCLTPTAVPGFSAGFAASTVIASAHNSAAVGTRGELYVWGRSHRKKPGSSGVDGDHEVPSSVL